ncbi:MAG: hypothetical protein IJM30_05110 [Thermoguttaceae bacterium]|nr:hypothetical protein [Thermoguttaceae bacterium]
MPPSNMKSESKRLSRFVAFIVVLFATTGAAQDKPAGFSGYLLDDSGLERSSDETAWKETFESSGVSWRHVYRDGSVEILAHKRVDNESRSGSRSEFIQYEAEEPGVVVFGHYVDYPCLYEGTSPTVWTRSDRPGVALAALVVFPNVLRPDTGEPLQAIVAGSSYKRPGEWTRLGFSQGLDKALEETAQAVRGEHKLPVDTSRAYVRQILLISEARYGRYSLWIDDLEIAEHVGSDVETLLRTERNAKFEPINLLSCRLKLSQTPIFWEDDPDEDDVYGKEPFGIDQDLAEKNKRKPLEFNASASVANDSRPARKTQGFGSAFELVGRDYDFAESALFLPSSDDYQQPGVALAQNSRAELSIPAEISGSGRIGQTALNESASSDPGRAAPAAFEYAPSAENEPEGADYLVLQPSSALVSGSGTLPSSALAAESGFFRESEKMIPNVRLENGNLTTPDNRVFSIRAIKYNGEPFSFLKKLGFNAIWLEEPASVDQLAEATETGIWLIAKPPVVGQFVEDAQFQAALEGSESEGTPPGAAEPSPTAVGSAYDSVLMWNIGSDLSFEDLDLNRDSIDKIRRLDQKYHRPLVGSVYNGLKEYVEGSAKLDVVLLNRSPLLTSLDLNDYGDWLINYQNLANLNAVAFWNQIQTQPAQSAELQRAYFNGAVEAPGLVSYEQMRQCVRLSLRAGCRGLFFDSHSPLDAKDRSAQYRAKALEAINLELQFLLPWVALGKAERKLLPTSENELSAILLQADRAALLAPVSTSPDNQYAMGRDAAPDLEGTVPVPESSSPDLLAPGALRKIPSKRKAGGSFFSLEDGSMNSLLFYARSDALSQKVSERALAYGKRIAEIAINLARKRVDMFEETAYALKYIESRGDAAEISPKAPAYGAVVDGALERLDDAEKSLRRGDVSQAYFEAERATREIRELERSFWSQATKTEIARPVTPLSTNFYDAPAYLELYKKLTSGKLRPSGGNLIEAGDMESVGAATDKGWRFYQRKSANLTGDIIFDAKAARSGDRGLCVRVAPEIEGRAPEEVECPVLVVEKSFPTRVGQLICVQGWIKIPNDLTNSVDGATVFDDQGGRALALRFKKASDWKRFAFYRLATSEGSMRIRFEFSGCGETYLDDIEAYVVE